MNSLLIILLLLTVFTGVSLFFYWVVFFPCVVLKSRFAIQKVCDDIHIAARAGKISSESHGFIVLAQSLDIARRAARHADMLSMASRAKISPSEYEAFEVQAAAVMKDTAEIREAFLTASRWIVALWLAVRPMHLLILAPLLVLAFFSDWAAKKADREKKGGFVAASGLPA